MLFTTFGLFVLACLPGVLGVRHITVSNRCPKDMPLYVDGRREAVLPKELGLVTRRVPDNWMGTISTTTNSPKRGAARLLAGFQLRSNYYYHIKEGKGPITVGMTISAQYSPFDGFCDRTTCDDQNCLTYKQHPIRLPATPAKNPAPPLHACPGNDVQFTVVFCPNGKFLEEEVKPRPQDPRPRTVVINPNGNKNKCLDVAEGKFQNGTPVQIFDCNGTPAQRWTVSRGSTAVKLAGTNYCLDAGSRPASGVKMKIWQCYDNLAAQSWVYGTDNHIKLASQNQCLDLTNGVLSNWNPVQTWECSANNKNQFWTTA